MREGEISNLNWKINSKKLIKEQVILQNLRMPSKILKWKDDLKRNVKPKFAQVLRQNAPELKNNLLESNMQCLSSKRRETDQSKKL